jgi:predicted DNA-binding protein
LVFLPVDVNEVAMSSLKELVNQWESHAQAKLTQETYAVRLQVEDAARLNALAEMYPKRSKEQLLSELLSAALSQMEASFPYVQGTKVIATDEMGDAIYEDVGPTPRFMELTRQYLHQSLS